MSLVEGCGLRHRKFQNADAGDMQILADDTARREALEALSATLAREARPVWAKIRASGLQAPAGDADAPPP